MKFQLFNLFRCRVTSNSFYRFIERFYRESILLNPVTSSKKLWTAISREQIKLLTCGVFCSSLFLKDCNISNYWKWVKFPFKTSIFSNVPLKRYRPMAYIRRFTVYYFSRKLSSGRWQIDVLFVCVPYMTSINRKLFSHTKHKEIQTVQ